MSSNSTTSILVRCWNTSSSCSDNNADTCKERQRGSYGGKLSKDEKVYQSFDNLMQSQTYKKNEYYYSGINPVEFRGQTCKDRKNRETMTPHTTFQINFQSEKQKPRQKTRMLKNGIAHGTKSKDRGLPGDG